MEPQQRQNAKYQATHMMSVLKDKTKIAVKTIKGEDAQVTLGATASFEVHHSSNIALAAPISLDGGAPAQRRLQHESMHLSYLCALIVSYNCCMGCSCPSVTLADAQ
jgi:hypothetical protein